MEVDLAELGMRLGGSFILFGSYVSGEMRFDSDLDLLIDMPADVVVQAFAEAEAMGRYHDLPLDLHDAAIASPDFVVRVRRRGRVALGATSKKIAEHLNAAGYRTRAGKLWHVGPLHKILTNPVYKGAYVYTRRDSRAGKHRPIEERVDVACPAIIDPGRFDAV